MRHQPAAAFSAADEHRRTVPLLSRNVPVQTIVAALACYFGLCQLLLWRFLDVMPLWAYVVGAPLVAAVSWLASGGTASKADADTGGDPTVATILVCLLVAFALLLLGGEGRLFYSNIDWQVRDAVLRDMAVNPWPFVYTATGGLDVLRAPLGMYLLPSLAFKAWGPTAGDWALLVQNSLMLAGLLALASTLFASARDRVVALTVFLVFSGLDVVGQWLVHRLHEHMEGWAGVQFSSTITLAFWVPQHAIAGWTGAVTFMLWRTGRLPLVSLLAIVPLTALWSPLSLMGSLPLALFAGVATLWRRELKARDILVPALSCLLVVPTLLYLGAAGDSVGFRPYPIWLTDYVLFESLEILPYLIPLALAAFRSRTDSATLLLVAACLLLAPLIQIGRSVDFTMRASIPALAILAVLVAQLLLRRAEQDDRLMRAWLVVALCIGSVTGLSELARAVSQPPAPRVTCSIFKAARQSFMPGPLTTYVAALDKMPELVRPRQPSLVSAAEPKRCWTGTWYRPTGV